MIDPTNITDYSASRYKLEELFLFCVLVAGKNAKTTAYALENALCSIGWVQGSSPFEVIRKYFNLNVTFPAKAMAQWLKSHGIGCYTLKAYSIYSVVVTNAFDLAAISSTSLAITCLDNLPGIGPKTARFFLLHTRKKARLAVIDTHMLKHLTSLGYKKIPKSTPQSSKRYSDLELIVLKLADSKNMTPAEYDLAIWNYYSKNSNVLP